MSREPRAYIGMGSNLESPERQLLAAFDALAASPGIHLTRRSSLYRTAPIGYAHQPDFLNAVAEILTRLSPDELLDTLLAIERRHGRVRDFANAPRTLDLDILIYGDVQLSNGRLVVPHPRAHERAFVLMPLLEIAPDCVIPGRGPARELLARVQDQGVAHVAEEVTFRLALGSLAEPTEPEQPPIAVL
jgi:2-amino-4-hydroxy-6-hydroxymethyldihydropteridine diphosphokinase